MSDALRGSQSAGGPPPLPGGAVQYFVGVNGSQVGPYDLTTLASKIQAGEITRQTLVWRAGMAGWTAAESVADLQTMFAQMPPPLPKS
jgi:hypothetical protein